MRCSGYFWGVKKGRESMCLFEPKVKINYRCSTVCVLKRKREGKREGQLFIFNLLLAAPGLLLHVGRPLVVESGASLA